MAENTVIIKTMNQRKFIITAELRDLEKQVSLGEISYSRMIEILNEKAYEWHTYKLQAYIDKQTKTK